MFRKEKTDAGNARYGGWVLYTNDAVNICYEASKSCYNAGIAYDIDKRLAYLKARNKEGHESVMEHSNLVFLLQVSRKMADSLVVLLNDGVRYLHTKTVVIGKYYYVLMGGSIRAYKNLIRSMYERDQNNKVLILIKDLLYQSAPMECFVDLFDNGIMYPNEFVGYDNISVFHKMKEAHVDDKTGYMDYLHRYNSIKEENVEFINVDPIEVVYEEVKQYGFTLLDIIDMCTITIKFKDMSRIITQQLTRHRNAITQESLRYVDGSNGKFIDPQLFKPEKYDPETKYLITMAYGETPLKYSITAQEYGDLLIKAYKQLRDQGMDKEDARSFLPMNVNSNLYVTFTYASLFHFLKLRMDSHAQAEIRYFANLIADSLIGDRKFKKFFSENTYTSSIEEIIDYCLIPKCNFVSDIPSVLEEAVGDMTTTVSQINTLSTKPEDPNEEMPDFGMAGAIPKAVNTSDSAAEEMYKKYNPETYSDTRDEK